MHPTNPPDTERDRRDAHRRYNEALTSLDRAVVRAGEQPAIARDELQALGSALMVFLQQVTPLVDTRERHVLATVGAQIGRLESTLEAIPELRAQIGVLQRAVQMLRRGLEAAPDSVPAPAATVAAPSPVRAPMSQPDGFTYLGFEDQFRGSDEEIRAKLMAYVPLFAGTRDVLDIGCGRGEFLALLQAERIPARGVDVNGEMVAVARERGLDAIDADALAYLASLPDGSLGGLIATQVVEHLEPAYLVRLLDAASRTLRPGAPIVLETINPACWLAFFSSYLRDFTHVRPVHPDTLQYLLRASGFDRVSIRFSAPVPDHLRMKPVELPAAVLGSPDPSAQALADAARVVNANAAILNNLLFTYLDYAAVGYRS